jgi:hypothetical protein
MSVSTSFSLFNHDSEFLDENDYNKFINRLTLHFLPLFHEYINCEIALTYVEIYRKTVPKNFRAKYNLNKNSLIRSRLDLLRICLPDTIISESNDSCIFEISPCDLAVGKHIKDLKYYPIVLKKDNLIKLELRDCKNDLISLSTLAAVKSNENYSTYCAFHIRNMGVFDVKYLKLESFNEVDKKYFDNTPVAFTSRISEMFHQNEDFSYWQVALDSVFLSNELMKYFKDAYSFEVGGGKTPFFDIMNPNANKPWLYIFGLDVKKKIIKREKIEDNSMFAFNCSNPVYFNVTKRLLDEITLTLTFYGDNEIVLKKSDINEKMYSRINLLFRRKI